MGLNLKKILDLSANIAGMAGVPIAPAVLKLASEVAPGEDPMKLVKKVDLDNWERIRIMEWVETYKRFMDRPMKSDVKEATFKGKLRSDFIMNYADMPDDKWVDAIHDMVKAAAIGMLAASG